ncbi:MAG TPA: hypothetical protein VN894_14440 [Polyangiaceae bacterium]|nr:hypothetical protein [Polyangiaceae bacterium]
MKRVWGHVLAALSVIAGVSAAFPACVHDDSTIFVQSVLAPQTSTQPGTACSFTADPTQPFLSSGTLDLELRPEYGAKFLIGNQMVAQANSSQLQTETSRVNIFHAIVRITTADSKEEVRRYTFDTQATLDPASGNTPGFASVGRVTLVDGKAVASDAVQAHLVPNGTVRLLTYVRFQGVTLGGQSVESNEFEFPVDICRGCLITFTNNPMYSQPNCVGNASAAASASQALLPCDNTVGQDLAVDCNACSSLGFTSCDGTVAPAAAGGGADGGSD